MNSFVRVFRWTHCFRFSLKIPCTAKKNSLATSGVSAKLVFLKIGFALGTLGPSECLSLRSSQPPLTRSLVQAFTPIHQ